MPASSVPLIASDARFGGMDEPRDNAFCHRLYESLDTRHDVGYERRETRVSISARYAAHVVECTPSNVRRGLPGKTANTVLSWETRLVDTVPSTGFPLGIVEERSRIVLFRRTPTMEFLRYISKFII